MLYCDDSLENQIRGQSMFFVIKRNSVVLLAAIVVMGIIGAGMLAGNSHTYINEAHPVAAELNKLTVIIDAGHGDPDGGAVAGDGTEEAELNLAVAKKLEIILQNAGCKVIMTRSDSMGIHNQDGKTSISQKKNEDMRKRRSIQANSGGDMFISVHMNKFEQTDCYGAQVVFQASDAPSEQLAMCIQSALKTGIDNGNKREAMANKSGIYLLKNVPIPSVIVECGFISNRDELALLKTEEYQSKIAWAIYMGIVEYAQR